MSKIQLFYKRTDGTVITLDEIKQRSMIYVRNLLFGMEIKADVQILKNWLRNDTKLAELPDDVLLDYWLTVEWSTKNLAKFSYENDHSNRRRDN